MELALACLDPGVTVGLTVICSGPLTTHVSSSGLYRYCVERAWSLSLKLALH